MMGGRKTQRLLLGLEFKGSGRNARLREGKSDKPIGSAKRGKKTPRGTLLQWEGGPQVARNDVTHCHFFSEGRGCTAF